MKTICLLTVYLLSMAMAAGNIFADQPETVNVQKKEVNILGEGSSINLENSNVNIQSPFGAINIKNPDSNITKSLSPEEEVSAENGGFINGELISINFSNQNLAGKSFVNAEIVNCNFTGADLTGADFSGADIINSNFNYAILTNSVFINATITGSNISFADLTNADLTNADIDNVVKNGIILTGATLTNVDMDEFIENEYSRKTFYQSQDIINALALEDSPEARIDLNVNFAFDSDQLTASGKKQVAEIAKALNTPSLQADRFLLEGHTDGVGSEAYNIDLSMRRALTVSHTLQNEYGVKVEMRTKGYGETRPVATNETEAGRAVNRRVSLVRLK
ncbi:MAG: hypothetical protein CSA34_06970 [Desulfobulbus propionicus]|nr:MAG: hypothetical protein CSA34_06970 [Desulfobulbus propionicus]